MYVAMQCVYVSVIMVVCVCVFDVCDYDGVCMCLMQWWCVYTSVALMVCVCVDGNGDVCMCL